MPILDSICSDMWKYETADITEVSLLISHGIPTTFHPHEQAQRHKTPPGQRNGGGWWGFFIQIGFLWTILGFEPMTQEPQVY